MAYTTWVPETQARRRHGHSDSLLASLASLTLTTAPILFLIWLDARKSWTERSRPSSWHAWGAACSQSGIERSAPRILVCHQLRKRTRATRIGGRCARMRPNYPKDVRRAWPTATQSRARVFSMDKSPSFLQFQFFDQTGSRTAPGDTLDGTAFNSLSRAAAVRGKLLTGPRFELLRT
jgi:hypothetical protein